MRRFRSGRVGAAWRLLAIGLLSSAAMAPARSQDASAGYNPADWSLHAQTTFVGQTHPPFRSPYQGAQSLTAAWQGRQTWTATAFIGRKLWEGGELYINPELNQGFGLSQTQGIAGFPNGEAQMAGSVYPKPHLQRFYLQQTFGLGGEQETIADDQNQIAGKKDISRLTITAGKFSVMDFFDNNTYAHDPRANFMNWSMWASAAFDYSANTYGYTVGVVAEVNQKDWALRVGRFAVPGLSDTDSFDPNWTERGSTVIELEQRFSPFGQPGKIRWLAWLNRAFAGSHAETLGNPSSNLDITQSRRTRSSYGYAVNVEQAISDSFGVFARASWNNGQTEVVSFTDIDRSVSFGGSLKGTSWGRPNDVVGFAGAINALSAPHRAFLAAGGMGILIGDGALNYRTEQIMETYYAMSLPNNVVLTFDYQLVVNPGYNADRGPVSLFALRFHAQI